MGTAEMGMYKLHEAPRTKLQLLKGEETMYPAEHAEVLNQVDQIPIFNKKGTQYFMDVAIGTPTQPFTVIFDTGSAVFGVFTDKAKLPESISSQLVSAVSFKVKADSMNTLMQWGGSDSLRGQAVVMAAAGADMSKGSASGGSWGFNSLAGLSVSGWAVGLVVAGLIVGNVALAGRVYAKSTASRGKKQNIDMSFSYGAVKTVAVPAEVL